MAAHDKNVMEYPFIDIHTYIHTYQFTLNFTRVMTMAVSTREATYSLFPQSGL
jgi:hypothetical protein